MTPLIVLTRRLAWLLLFSIVGGTLLTLVRNRGTATIPAAPEWPPLDVDANPAPAQPAASTDVATWAEPADGGTCPDGYPIKVNLKSGVFHVPGGRFYDRTKAQRCYAAAEDAIADGYRQSKS